MHLHFGSKYLRLAALILSGCIASSCSASNSQMQQSGALSQSSNAQNRAAELQPAGHVNDFAEVLQADQMRTLEQLADEFHQQKRVEVAVVIVKTLDGKSIEEFTLELGKRWGVGHPETRHAIVIGVAIEERQSRIEVSRGLEAAVPAEEWSRILTDARPEFKKSEYGAGLLKIMNALSGVLDKYPR